jgi:anti-sigma B factor antagonist
VSVPLNVPVEGGGLASRPADLTGEPRSIVGAVEPAEFTAVIHEEKLQTVVCLTGELDMASAPCFSRSLITALQRGAALLVIDVGQLDYIDACGLGVMVATRQALQLQSRDLVLRDPSAMLRKLLAIVHMGELVERT